MMKALVVAVVLSVSVAPSVLVLNAAAQKQAAQVKRGVFSISGMSCSGCAAGIKAMLKRTYGVVSAEVSYDAAEAKVTYDGTRTSEAKIIEVISKMGYKAASKKR